MPNAYSIAWPKEISLSEERGFGLDPSFVTVEKFPLIVSPLPQIPLRRLFHDQADEV